MEQMIALIAVVIGAILGYLASYLNNRQQRQWQLNDQYRAWQREQITKDYQAVMPLMQIYNELAHLYIEYHEASRNNVVQDLLFNKRQDVLKFLKQDLAPFPVALKVGTTKSILENLDRVTDRIEKIGLIDNNEIEIEKMKEYLEEIRTIEKDLNDQLHAAIKKTFK